MNMNRLPPLAPAVVLQIRRMRARKIAWEAIAQEFGMKSETLRRRVDPAYAEKRASRRRQKYVPRFDRYERIENGPRRVDVPHDVMAEREKRLMAPRSLTASICGDPPEGYSALERRS